MRKSRQESARIKAILLTLLVLGALLATPLLGDALSARSSRAATNEARAYPYPYPYPWRAPLIFLPFVRHAGLEAAPGPTATPSPSPTLTPSPSPTLTPIPPYP